MDKETESEGIEALVYPADDLMKRLDVTRGAPEAAAPVCAHIEEIVEKANKGLQPYQRISKVTVLDEALEMTTTRKVKRVYRK